MNLEQTLTIIKPDGIKNIEKIIAMFYENDLKIIKYKIVKLDKEILKKHYAHILDKPYYKEIEEHMTSNHVVIMILEGFNAIKKLRDLMGVTDSRKANKNTIRGLFGTDTTKNAIHGSDSIESANIEIERFFVNNINKKVLKLY